MQFLVCHFFSPPPVFLFTCLVLGILGKRLLFLFSFRICFRTPTNVARKFFSNLFLDRSQQCALLMKSNTMCSKWKGKNGCELSRHDMCVCKWVLSRPIAVSYRESKCNLGVTRFMQMEVSRSRHMKNDFLFVRMRVDQFARCDWYVLLR